MFSEYLKLNFKEDVEHQEIEMYIPRKNMNPTTWLEVVT